MISIGKGSVMAMLCAMLASPVFAQGRHDEKPHGTMKPEAGEQSERKSTPAAGRHDEKPHGMAKKPKAPKAEAGEKGKKQ